MVILRTSPFQLEALDSDYAGDNHDRRSTSGGCQYLGRRLVSWQCKKQTIVAISSTEAEYVAAASCCAQNADFYQIIDFLTGCSINYSLLVDPDLIGPWLQQFWATASLKVINDVPHIRAKLIAFLSKLFGTCSEILATRSSNSLQAEEETKYKSLIQGLKFCKDAQGTPNSKCWLILNVLLQYKVLLPSMVLLQHKILCSSTEVKRLKRQTLSQAKQIIKLKAKLKKLSKFVQPVVQHHAFWVENQNLKKQKRRRKKHKKKVSSVKLGRNKDEGTLKSDGLKEVNIEEKEASNVKSGETEELDLETTQSTARQGTITPRTLNFEDEAGPSSPLRPIQVMESEEQLKVAEVLVAISRPRGLSIPGPIQSQSLSIPICSFQEGHHVVLVNKL
ncbi:putative ribonuclease H-like domain-containing protein [Tanacetum coccineum]